METTEQTIRLTQYSRGAGCGCKIAPAVLEEILKTSASLPVDTKLLVGNSSNDDAAVYDMGNGMALISTTDFFMPVVDDAYDFGRIASANAISDIYAMGGKPLMAIAILGWPVEKLSAALAQRVLEGSRAICGEARIPLAGGHSIDSTEPIFGLAVTGIVPLENLKKNSSAKDGDLLFLTKPIGVGILSTAQKRGVIEDKHYDIMVDHMVQLNSLGQTLGGIKGVTAMTDVTGFGLLGHLIEMAEGSDISVELYYSKIPVVDGAKDYLSQRIVPDATYRNWNAYSAKTAFEAGVDVMQAFNLLPDPQTNGGILISVDPSALADVELAFVQSGLLHFFVPIGKCISKSEKLVKVQA